MCKDSIGGEESGPNTGLGGSGMSGPSAGLPSGFNNSVYVMLLAFGGTLGLVGYTLVRGGRSGVNYRSEKSRDDHEAK